VLETEGKRALGPRPNMSKKAGEFPRYANIL